MRRNDGRGGQSGKLLTILVVLLGIGLAVMVAYHASREKEPGGNPTREAERTLDMAGILTIDGMTREEIKKKYPKGFEEEISADGGRVLVYTNQENKMKFTLTFDDGGKLVQRQSDPLAEEK